MLDPARGLLRDGKPLPVGQRGIALLAALLEAEGEAVPKADLMDKAWPGLAVEEGNLTVQIAALRKALGKGPDGQEWIVTVPRLGYRLSTGSPPRDASAGGPALAVLPFQNLVGDAGQDYFCDGIVAEIITALARFKSFAVVARNSSFAYKGRAIDVRLAAEELGTFWRVASRARATASGSARNWSTADRVPISGPSSSTASSAICSISRTASPKASPRWSNLRLGPPRSNAPAARGRAASPPTTSICVPWRI